MSNLFYPLLLAVLLHLDTSAQFNNIETPNQKLVYYGEASSYMVKYVGRCVENALGFHSSLYHYNPSEKVIPMKLTISSSNGTVVHENILEFQVSGVRWRTLNTNTGTSINAGKYKVRLSPIGISGIGIDALAVQ